MTRAFVLTGGGSLGAVQVGMLQALAERGVEPDLLVGTSAGALNAAWVATHGAGPAELQELAELWCGLSREDIFPVRPWHFVRAVAGRDRSLFPNDGLRALIDRNVPPASRVECTGIPLHVVTADLLTGQTVVFSQGPLVEAVLASAAIPGILPPVEIEGRHLADGAVADSTGLAVARDLGADEIVVLPAGISCALTRPPSSALGCSLQAVSLLLHQGAAHDVAMLTPLVSLRLLPPLCPLAVPTSDFSHARELITRARQTSLDWIDAGNLDAPDPARFMATHAHGDHEPPHDLTLRSRTRWTTPLGDDVASTS